MSNDIVRMESLNQTSFFEKNLKKLKVRKEVQEYPNKPLEEAFRDKLYDKSEVIDEF
jgi:hypothetical protein